MENNTKKALSVINYTKKDNKAYAGKKFESAYHTVKLGDKVFTGQRKNFDRIDNLEKEFDFTGKVVLDIGCNAGGLLHGLSSKIKYGVGVDFSSKCINAANIIKDHNSISNLNFYTFNLDKEDVNIIPNFVLSDKIDVCCFLAMAKWVKMWKEVVGFCKENSPYLIFESNGRVRFQSEQLSFLKNNYSSVTKIKNEEGNTARLIYLCKR